MKKRFLIIFLGGLLWSATGGSADDYFIWPYFKNFVF